MYAMRRELNQYRQVGHLSEAAVADPHRLIQMLFEGALERVAVARGAMEQGNIRLKGEKVSQAITIIDGLRTCLDHGKGVDLSEKLEALYDYLSRRLLEANLHNDLAALDEVSQLLRDLKSGWDAIPGMLRRGS